MLVYSSSGDDLPNGFHKEELKLTCPMASHKEELKEAAVVMT